LEKEREKEKKFQKILVPRKEKHLDLGRKRRGPKPGKEKKEKGPFKKEQGTCKKGMGARTAMKKKETEGEQVNYPEGSRRGKTGCGGRREREDVL